MDKLEKFMELYIKTLNQSRRFGIFGINDEDYEQYDKDKQELIKMYDEKQEKPVIRCKEYEVNYIGEENCIGQMQDRYEIHWQGKSCWQYVTSETTDFIFVKGRIYEEKDGMLITDDFIFIKE